jgi:alginate O-acetyltransferase complex protein AlgI
MVFTQAEFLVFLVVVLLVTWQLPQRRLRNGFLLVASYYFYAYWDYRFCGLLALSTCIDFVAAKKIASSTALSSRKFWLAVSLVSNLGILGFFKYYNFFIESATAILQPFGWHTQTLSIILPVGISFYTFQTLSYTIDVYRNKIPPVFDFVDFALYVAFFPQLVAGPIVRAAELMPQLQVIPQWSQIRFYNGCSQLLRGAVKKVLIADHLAEMVDVVFAGPDLYGGPTLWLASFAYAGQIYYDFSGYSDMAIGIAKLLGYRFPANFRHPYLSTSLREFWHRWHMTLSRWLRDYLYKPLGGNRGSTPQQYRTLLLTMLLGGLWHGAAWTFVAWGLLHGVGLAIERSWKQSQVRFGATSQSRSEPGPQWMRWFITMLVVLVGWILFRSPNLDLAMRYLKRMWWWQGGIDWFPPLVLGVIACMIFEHLVYQTRYRFVLRLPSGTWYSPVVITVMVWMLVLYAPRGFRPFVYFQF